MTRARDLADMISSGKIELAEIATSTQESLGNTDQTMTSVTFIRLGDT